MKKILITLSCLLTVIITNVSHGATTNGYVMGPCSNSALVSFCSNSVHNCGSSSSTIRPPVGYDYCSALTVSGQTEKYVVCVSTSAMCNTLGNCPENHKGVVTVSLSRTTVGSATVTYTQKCCNMATCVALPFTDVPGENYQRDTRQYCTATGTCAQTQPVWRCKAGYYNTQGVAPTARVPDCASCATATDISVATSAAGSYNITDCYIPPNLSLNGNNGNFKYTQICFYRQ